MPRPPLKRRKSNPKSPKGRVDNSRTAQIRQQLDRKLANKPVGPRPADSDDSDRLVTRTPASRHQNGGLRKEIFASGAVGKGDKPGAYPTRAERRKNLHNDTDRIIRDSHSRSNSTLASKSPSGSSPASTKSHVNVRTSGVAPQLEVAHEVPRTAAKPLRIGNASKLHQTPSGDASILGTLKPRKRQASILHLIDNEDSSLINPEDEEQFLPDDESTPLQDHKAPSLVGATPLFSTAASVSRKRKLGADVTPSLVNHQAARLTGQTSAQHLHNELTKSSVTEQTRLPSQSLLAGTNELQGDLDVMALPQSSSPESSPQPSSPRQFRRSTTAIPSTEQLQSLMPSKRRKGTRQRRPVNDLEIAEDSSSDLIEEVDESIYLPKKRSSRRAYPKVGASKTFRDRSKIPTTPPNNPTSTTPASLRHSKIISRTPMPLTRSINAENRKLRSTSSQPKSVVQSEDPDCRQSGRRASEAIKSNKPSGGYRQNNTRAVRSTRNGAATIDQENIERGGLAGSKPVAEVTTLLPTNDIDAETLEVEVSQTHSKPKIDHANIARTTNTQVITSDSATPLAVDDASRWKSKWADIDEWPLEYEEVDASTQSSSPTRR